MPFREDRLAQNEVRFREINESAQSQRVEEGGGRFVCECGDRSCMLWIEIPLDVYSDRRRNSHYFFVAAGHEIPDIERVVEEHPGFFVIEKPEEVGHIVE
jgi:hypothetical protein